jgi:hypothetical protein
MDAAIPRHIVYIYHVSPFASYQKSSFLRLAPRGVYKQKNIAISIFYTEIYHQTIPIFSKRKIKYFFFEKWKFIEKMRFPN